MGRKAANIIINRRANLFDRRGGAIQSYSLQSFANLNGDYLGVTVSSIFNMRSPIRPIFEFPRWIEFMGYKFLLVLK